MDYRQPQAGQALVHKIAHGYSNQALTRRKRGAYYRQLKTNGAPWIIDNPIDERPDFRPSGKSTVHEIVDISCYWY